MTTETDSRLEVLRGAAEHALKHGSSSVAVNAEWLVAALSRTQTAEKERDELRAAKWDVKHVDTLNDMAATGLARDEAEARTQAAEKALEEAGTLIARLREAVEFAKRKFNELHNDKNGLPGVRNYALAATITLDAILIDTPDGDRVPSRAELEEMGFGDLLEPEAGT